MSNFATFLRGEKRRGDTKENNYDRRLTRSADTATSAPMTYEDMQNVIRSLRDGRGALVDLKSTPYAEAQRLLDFLSGAVMALDASMEKADTKMYLVTPKGVSVSLMKK